LPGAIVVAAVTLGRTSPRARVGWRGRDVALGYGVLVVVVAVCLAVVPAAAAGRVISSSSTNLVNLRLHPPFVMVVSAFVEPSLWELWIVVPVVWALGEVQRWLGRAAVLVVGVLGHVGTTLFVSTVLTAGIAKGRIALAEATATDVGVSYVLVAALGLLAARVPGARRLWYVAGLSSFFVGSLLVARSFTDLGHLVAWTLGLGLAVLVSRAAGAVALRSGVVGEDGVEAAPHLREQVDDAGLLFGSAADQRLVHRADQVPGGLP
jgi:hypothetical protein